MSKSFGSGELHKCLKKLGFYPEDSSSSHVKYYHKDGKRGEYPFIMLQMGKKTYGHNSCNRYIQELKKFGFTKEEIEKYL